jgi:hypothetical protein
MTQWLHSNFSISRALTVVLIAACGHAAAPGRSAPNAPSPAPAPASGDPMVFTTLELAPDGQGWTLAFRLKNTSGKELQGQVVEPFVEFELEVTSDKGEHLSVAQPAFNLPGRPRPLVLAPGAEVRLQTPFRLRFDPSVPPSGGSDPLVWSIRSPKVAALARASFEIVGLGAQRAQARIE